MEDKKEKHRLHVTWVFFILYMVLLIYFLFFAEITGRTFSDREYHYNLVPLREIKRFLIYRESLGWFAVTANLFGNVVGFVPLGTILPMLMRKNRKFYSIVLLSFEFSLLVETVQLISKVGSFDVDDLILNTLGGAIGYLIFWLVGCLRRKKNDKEKESL